MPTSSFRQAQRNLQVTLRHAEGGAEDGLAVVGIMITNQVKVLTTGPAPSQPGRPPGLRTGGLRLSYKWEVRKGRGKRRESYVAVYSDKTTVQPVPPAPGKTPQPVIYAPFLEHGTSRMAARPHLRPAVNTVRPLIPGIVATSWNRGLRRGAGT